MLMAFGFKSAAFTVAMNKKIVKNDKNRNIRPPNSVEYKAGMHYPETKKGDVVDDYFGTKVADPYRWMESLDSPEVAAWITAQNEITERYLTQLPLRVHFRERITQLWNYPKVTLPVSEGGRYFYQKNSGLQRQSPLYVREGLPAAPKLILDPNILSPDGSLSLTQWMPSPDGRLLAYGISEGGADWRTIYVR